MHTPDDAERMTDRHLVSVGQFDPSVLFVGLDSRLLLCKRQPEAAMGIHVAVGDMMNQLADRPATGAVRSVQLFIRPAVEGRFQ